MMAPMRCLPYLERPCLPVSLWRPLQVWPRWPSITEIAQEQLLERFAPPAVIVTANGDIVYFHGRTGKYLEPSPGKANLNVFAMAREGLRYSILTALRTASKERREVTAEESVGTDGGGGQRRVKLTVQPIPKRPRMTELFMVTFVDLPERNPLSKPGLQSRAEASRSCRIHAMQCWSVS